MRSRAVTLPRSVLIASVLAALVACQRSPQNAFVAHGPLPPPPSGTLKFAGTPPAHPFHKEAGNYYTRTVFETDGPSNSRIEVRDVLIPPRGKSQFAALPGPAVLDLATGTARLMTGGKPEAIAAGAMRSLPAGQALELENPDARPAIMRLYVIRAR
jgi:hypothetical protein